MIGIVLIGMGDAGKGVMAQIVNCDDDAKRSTIRSAELDGEREAIREIWAHLADPVIPRQHGDVVFKVARYAKYDDRVWTWIGCYRMAIFPDGRPNTYVGCGVFSLNRMLDVTQVEPLINVTCDDLLDHSDSPVVTKPVRNFDFGKVRFDPPALSVPGPIEFGLRPNVIRSGYGDLSQVTKPKDFNDRLLAVMHQAQRLESYRAYSEIVISNSSELADRAAGSPSFDELWPQGSPATAIDASRPTVPPAPVVAPSIASVPASLAISPIMDSFAEPVQPSIDSLTRTVADLQHRVRDLEVARNAEPAAQPKRIMPDRRMLAQLAGVAAAMFFGVVFVGYVAYPALFPPKAPELTPRTALESCLRHDPVNPDQLTDDDIATFNMEWSCLKRQLVAIRKRGAEITKTRAAFRDQRAALETSETR